MHENTDGKGEDRREVGVIADRVGELPEKGQPEQQRGDHDHRPAAILPEQPDAQDNQRRRRDFRFHRPHDDVDIGAQHQHVGEHVERRERRLRIQAEAEAVIERGKYADGDDDGREQPEDSGQHEADDIEIPVQRTGQYEAADDEKCNDSAVAVAQRLHDGQDRMIQQAAKRPIDPRLRHMHERDRQRGDAAHGLDTGNELSLMEAGHAGCRGSTGLQRS